MIQTQTFSKMAKKLFYQYVESIDEAYHTEDGIEYEVGRNTINFDDPEKALKFYKENLSHWSSGIDSNDAKFVEDNPKIACYVETLD